MRAFRLPRWLRMLLRAWAADFWREATLRAKLDPGC